MTKTKYIPVLVSILAALILLASPVCAEEIGGNCGSNLSWNLDTATGTLTITGQGAMTYGDYAPWSDYSYDITNVVIGEGVTTVSYNAFQGMLNLHTVSLPSTVRSIGEYAFYGCSGLQNISLVYVENIDQYAFYDCRSLSSLTIPSGILTISYGAFSGCSGLQSIQFHGGVTQIGSYAFSGCSSLTTVTIPDSVTFIGDSAFTDCYSLSSVSLSNSLTSLGDNAFSSCPNLTSIRIPDSLAELKDYTFSGCSSLQEVVLGAGLSYIDTTAFNTCSSLRAFTLNSGNSSFSVDRGVLYNGSRTELVLMPKGFSGSYTVLSGTTKIGEYSCDEVLGLTSITLPNSVTVIDRYAFSGVSSLASIQLSNNLQIIGGSSLARTGISEIYIPASVTKIESHAFGGCYQLSKITFSGNAPDIHYAAFSEVSAIVYYPGDNPSWNNDTIDLYGGLLEWVSTSCKAHNPVTDPAQAPTCTESGWTEGSHCSNCRAVLKEQTMIPAKGHSYTNWIVLDTETHKCVCNVCGNEETTSHTWDAGLVTKQADCVTFGEVRYTCTGCKHTNTEEIPQTAHTYDHDCDTACNVCGEERITSHDYTDTHQSDRQNHWYQCKVCGEVKDVAPHTPGDAATEELPQICTVCDYVLVPALNHTHQFADTWSWDEAEHWYDCDSCPMYGSKEAHTFKNACDPNCDVCGFTRQVAHTFTTEWECDSSGHWQRCTVCDILDVMQNHIPGSIATETSAQTCTICGYELAPALSTEPPTETTALTEQDEPVPDTEYPWWTLVLILSATAIGTILFLNRKKK